MKKIIYSLLFAAALSSCYEDKGNYDYKLDSMNEITSVTFSPSIMETAEGKVIEIQQALDEEDTYRRIDVMLEQTLMENFNELEFNWFRTYTDASGKYIKDTIHSKGFLEFELPVGKGMKYDIFLQIYDKITTLSHYSQFKIMTRPIFKNSLFVLHGNEGELKLGNIEVIGDETKIRTDITTVTPEENDGNWYNNAIGFAYTTYWDLSYGRSGSANSIIVFDNLGGAKAYNPFGMTIKYSTEQVLRPENENFTFKKTVQVGSSTDAIGLYRIVLSEEGDIFVGNMVYPLYKPGEGYQGVLDNQSDYQITAATISDERFIFWDAKNNRFLYAEKVGNKFPNQEDQAEGQFQTLDTPLLDAKVDFSGFTSPEGMTAIIGYINYRESYDTQSAYFIFKDSKNVFYRYKLSADKKNSGSTNTDNNAAIAIMEVETLKPFMPNCDLNTITYNSWFTTNFLFYSDGKTIYRYSVSSGDNVPVYTAPEGYDITMMKFLTDDAASHTRDLGRILSIALYNETKQAGAVAEIMFNTAADIEKDFEPLFYDKDENNLPWGKIRDMQFANETDIAINK
ncbi:MAG: hypothetical protein IIU90_06655 [Bacteroidaceae bacterium]|nr:hypothetical protein [Bacteroidaceae bacterium]